MHRGLYTGACGMLVQASHLDSIANNLANVDTTGYKRDETLFKEFPKMPIHRLYDSYSWTPKGKLDERPAVGWLGTGVGIDGVVPIFTPGPTKQTGNDFDLAISGKGFFVIEAPWGEAYTRNGAFTISNDGYLSTQDGYRVLGKNGPIPVKNGNFFVREENGAIVYNEEGKTNDWKTAKEQDTLRIVSFGNESGLKKKGDCFFEATQDSGLPEPMKNTRILQRSLEGSNVSPVEELVKMIEVQRVYEACQKSIQAIDDTMKLSISDVGRVA
ncbi:MAG: flagellar basal-body rod protein FlgF [Candidatus Desantisbacteria bacterium]